MNLTVNSAQMNYQNNRLSLLFFSVILSNPSIKDSPEIEIQIFPSDNITMESTEKEVIAAALAKIKSSADNNY